MRARILRKGTSMLSGKIRGKSERFHWFLGLICTLGMSGSIAAAELYGDANGIYLTEFPAGAESMQIRGPRGFTVTVDSLEYVGDEPLAPGKYRYQIYGPTPDAVAPPTPDPMTNAENGRSANWTPGIPVTVFSSGYFIIEDGGNLQSVE